MQHVELETIAEQWDHMTSLVLNLRELPLAQMQELLCDTYKVLTQFHKEPLVPKQTFRLLLNIEEYLYFAALMEGDDVPVDYYCHRQIYVIVKSLKGGFLRGEYTCAFPELQIFDEFENDHVINLEKNFLPL